MSETKTFDQFANFSQPPVLNQILAQTEALGFDMASEPRTGALLRTLAASKPGGRFLELWIGLGGK